MTFASLLSVIICSKLFTWKISSIFFLDVLSLSLPVSITFCLFLTLSLRFFHLLSLILPFPLPLSISPLLLSLTFSLCLITPPPMLFSLFLLPALLLLSFSPSPLALFKSKHLRWSFMTTDTHRQKVKVKLLIRTQFWLRFFALYFSDPESFNTTKSSKQQQQKISDVYHIKRLFDRWLHT